MKFKTSCCNRGLLRKDLGRFAPAWVLYTLCLALGMVILFEGNGPEQFTINLGRSIRFMPLVNCGYAILTAVLLFGDLYDSRMCNALHALPVRREGWFAVHFAAGLLFSLIPTALMTLFALPVTCLSPMAGSWKLALLWFAATNAQYLCFFGMALLAVFCVGNRFAAVLVYAGLNFGALLVYFLGDTLYAPLLYGVSVKALPFFPFSPVVQMMRQSYVDFQWAHGSHTTQAESFAFAFGQGWSYLWLCAGLGLLLSILSLQLYRKRELERAGDFIAVGWVKPVFLVFYCLTCATMFQLVQELFGTQLPMPLFLFAGFTVGFFTCRMLLERSTRVFRKGSILSYLLLAAVLGGSLGLTWLDPMNIAGRIPEVEAISSVRVSEYGYGGYIDVTEGADIQAVRDLHKAALGERASEENGMLIDGVVRPYEDGDDWNAAGKSIAFYLTYTLKNGCEVSREYHIWSSSAAGDALRTFMSRPEFFLRYDELSGIPDRITVPKYLYIDGMDIPEERLTRELAQAMFDALAADAAEGTTAQDLYFHPRYDKEGNLLDVRYVHMLMDGMDYDFHIYPDTAHLLQWLEDYELIS